MMSSSILPTSAQIRSRSIGRGQLRQHHVIPETPLSAAERHSTGNGTLCHSSDLPDGATLLVNTGNCSGNAGSRLLCTGTTEGYKTFIWAKSALTGPKHCNTQNAESAHEHVTLGLMFVFDLSLSFISPFPSTFLPLLKSHNDNNDGSANIEHACHTFHGDYNARRFTHRHIPTQLSPTRL